MFSPQSPNLCFCSIPEYEVGWGVVRGKFLAINAASMSCACPRSPKGLSPAAHLADGTTDLILVRKCSRFNFLRHLLRHTSKDDQVTTLDGATAMMSCFLWLLQPRSIGVFA